MRRSLCFVVLFFSVPFISAQEFKMEPPKSPAESLKTIKARPGFKVELMVAEPLVMDPIAFAWGPDGKFWVVEMGDYPLGVDGKNKPGGKIKYLEKSKADGPYDKMTVFMDNLGFPTGVFPYGKGVLVTCTPDIFYAEMGKDGKVKKEVIFTGFRQGNQQHRVNGLVWGIDNWIYGANGDSGGVIEGGKLAGLLKRTMMKGAVNISGRDFRFKVETGEFETQTGQSQFGRCRDDWGNWFGNNNSNPMYHYVLDDQYLKRNPHVLYPDPKVQVPVKPGAQPVFPISKPLPRFNSPQALNHFTSACSTIIYRDTLFGKEFEGNMFVSEPVHNLVHREIMKPKGVTFTSQRADDEQTSEFLASSDNWFRPTMIQVGPDGALWIADMYRYVIEHPEWIPKDWQKKLDLRAGHDLGRIYRVYPTDKKPRDIVRMDKMDVKELVKQLESDSGWVRDMAHRMLIAKTEQGGEATAKDITKLLGGMVPKTALPQARLHALYYHAEYYDSNWKTIGPYVADKNPGVRKHAIRLLDPVNFLNTLPAVLDGLETDSNEQVRLQYAFSLGTAHEIESDPKRLIRMIKNNSDNPYILAASLSSISNRIWKEVFAALMKEKEIPTKAVVALMGMSAAYGAPMDPSRLFLRHIQSQEKVSVAHQYVFVSEMLDVMEKNNISLKKMINDAPAGERAKTLEHLFKIYLSAADVVQSPKATSNDKLLAMRLLARGLGDDNADRKTLVAFLTPQTPDDVQVAVIGQLSRTFDPRVPGLLLEPWKSYSPTLRGQVLDALLSRPVWASATLDAIKKKQVPAHEIDAIRRQRLLQHKDAQIRATAAKLFAAASDPDRGKVVDLYWVQLPDKTDAARGAKLFTKSCAVCHKLGGVGQDVGPDLASVGDKSVQGLLTAILDPNRAVEARYINYSAVTKGGKTYNGILASETSTSITLIGADGKPQQLLRNELDELSSSGKSMMPDGLEKDLSPQDVADIIEYVRTNQPKSKDAKAKEPPGNTPRTVRPEKGSAFRGPTIIGSGGPIVLGKVGSFHLLPKDAGIFGPSVVIEKQHGNLGFWSSPEDHVIWSLDAPKAGVYDVWLHYACADDSAGNTLALRIGKSRLLYQVEGTGSWDDYRGVRIGELQLNAGTQEIIARSEGAIRGALIDLKKVELSPR